VTATPTPAKLPVRPKWLPMEVQIEAERILDSGHADEALVLRLATDKRMKFVWRELEKCKQVSGCLSDWIALMNDRVDVQLPQDADALALFFWCAYTIAWLGAEVGTVSVHDLPIAQYQAVAAGLRYSAAKLRELRLRHGVQAEDHRWRWSSGDGPWDMHIREIEEAAKFCDENVEAFTEVKAAESPLGCRSYLWEPPSARLCANAGNRDARLLRSTAGRHIGHSRVRGFNEGRYDHAGSQLVRHPC
jgi:hypothetical protein